MPVRGLASADLQPYSGLVLRCCAFAPHPLHIASNPSSQRHSITVDIVVDVVLSSHAARADVAAAAAAAAAAAVVCACGKPTQSGQRDEPLTSSKCTIIHCDTVVVQCAHSQLIHHLCAVIVDIFFFYCSTAAISNAGSFCRFIISFLSLSSMFRGFLQ